MCRVTQRIGDHSWSSFWFSNKQHYLSLSSSDHILQLTFPSSWNCLASHISWSALIRSHQFFPLSTELNIGLFLPLPPPAVGWYTHQAKVHSFLLLTRSPLFSHFLLSLCCFFLQPHDLSFPTLFGWGGELSDIRLAQDSAWGSARIRWHHSYYRISRFCVL